jgi:uncharacterized repeat protein (TIGR03803 family)
MKNLVLSFALVVGLKLAQCVTAQTFSTLHSFDNYYNEGANPYAGVILSSNVLYGTAKYEGSSRAGVAYAVGVNGTGFTNLHNFLGFPNEGGFPEGGLVLSSNVLYGTSREGTSGSGTVFKVNTDGTGFTTLYTFVPNTDGSDPHAALILAGNVLYGTAVNGGSYSRGTVFRLNIDGTGFTNLHNFSEIYPTNSDGAHPYGGLVLSSNKLYGTTFDGGNGGVGTVFAVNTDGSNFNTLYGFTPLSGLYPFYTNSDGANPQAGLIWSGNRLYGAAQNGGSAGAGTVFAIYVDGTGFTNLHSFAEANGAGPYYTNTDGIYPEGGLVLSSNTLYGTAYGGGSAGVGTVFALNTDGTAFTVLLSFAGSNGENPTAGPIYSDNTLYGTTAFGGSAHGIVFSLALLPPQLKIFPAGTNVILTWPMNAVGFTLQSTTNLVSPIDWKSVSPEPIVLNSENSVTNSISEGQKFYRLSR